MTRSDLVEHLAEQFAQLGQRDAELAVRAILDALSDAMIPATATPDPTTSPVPATISHCSRAGSTPSERAAASPRVSASRFVDLAVSP